MGRKAKKIDLTQAARSALENGYKRSKSSTFSKRCHIILLKSQGRSSEEIAKIFGITIQPVNSWVKRYEKQGIEGLTTKPGRGRPAIFDTQRDEAKVKEVVKKERQRLKRAKEILETELDKKFSLLTLKRFLKNLSADGNEFD